MNDNVPVITRHCTNLVLVKSFKIDVSKLVVDVLEVIMRQQGITFNHVTDSVKIPPRKSVPRTSSSPIQSPIEHRQHLHHVHTDSQSFGELQSQLLLRIQLILPALLDCPHRETASNQLRRQAHLRCFRYTEWFVSLSLVPNPKSDLVFISCREGSTLPGFLVGTLQNSHHRLTLHFFVL